MNSLAAIAEQADVSPMLPPGEQHPKASGGFRSIFGLFKQNNSRINLNKEKEKPSKVPRISSEAEMNDIEDDIHIEGQSQEEDDQNCDIFLSLCGHKLTKQAIESNRLTEE